MNAIFHSLLISAAVILLWYLWERWWASIQNEAAGILVIFFGKESPDIIGFILPWLGVATLHYFVPTFWFWFIIGVATLLILAPVFGNTVVWWIILFLLIGIAVWHTRSRKTNSPQTIETEVSSAFKNEIFPVLTSNWQFFSVDAT